MSRWQSQQKRGHHACLIEGGHFCGRLRWPEPIYMRVGYVFDLRFSEWKIQPISMIFGICNK